MDTLAVLLEPELGRGSQGCPAESFVTQHAVDDALHADAHASRPRAAWGQQRLRTGRPVRPAGSPEGGLLVPV